MNLLLLLKVRGEKMNKRLQYIMFACFWLGLLILSLSSIFRHSLTDFTLGFCEGVSFSLIVIGFIYLFWCFIKKKNPYKI